MIGRELYVTRHVGLLSLLDCLDLIPALCTIACQVAELVRLLARTLTDGTCLEYYHPSRSRPLDGTLGVQDYRLIRSRPAFGTYFSYRLLRAVGM